MRQVQQIDGFDRRETLASKEARDDRNSIVSARRDLYCLRLMYIDANCTSNEKSHRAAGRRIVRERRLASTKFKGKPPKTENDDDLGNCSESMVALIYPHEISGRPALTRARELRHPLKKDAAAQTRIGRRRQEIYNHYSFDISM